MQNIHEIFAEFTSHPDFHIGFLWKTRISFFKLKQKDVARTAGIEETTLSKIIQRKAIPKPDTITKVENALTVMTRRQ
jgi:hypothetical protein